jgi:hypothetical protein
MHLRFAAVRVRVTHRDYWRKDPHPEQWMLIEWPTASIALRKLVATAKLRWRTERDYEELKQELGWGHFEGRNWRGFHHHATLSIAAYGFLIRERCFFPPQATRSKPKQPTSRFTYPKCNPTARPDALRVRTERHSSHSIATLRRQIATHITRSLLRRPCCLRGCL